MTLKALATAAVMTLAATTASFAVPIDFNFSLSDGTNTITGLIEGLNRDGSNQQATRITVDGVFDTYVLSAFFSNSFSVSSGEIDLNSVDVISSALGSTGTNSIGLIWNGSAGSFESIEEAIFTGARLEVAGNIAFTPVTAVPLPAGGLLLLSGLVGIAGLKRRKKRAA